MDILRDGFDGLYNLIKPIVFRMSTKNSKFAHNLFVNSLRGLSVLGLDKLILDNNSNYIKASYEISNAAGFLKNAEINPGIMRLLGFDRVVVGTFTAYNWKGNSGRTLWRFPKSKSMVNWEGWPNIGAEEGALKLYEYGEHEVPLTISLGPTPWKKGDAFLRDLEKTVSVFRDVPYVNRFEFDGSCLNVDKSSWSEGWRRDALNIISREKRDWQDAYLKVSPDLSEFETDEIIRDGEEYKIKGYVISNSTANHDSRYVDVSPGKGGGSGNMVYDLSRKVQGYFAERVKEEVDLIACGGIDSIERVRERCRIGNCKEVQVLTGMIFKGAGLLRELKEK